MYYIRLIKLNLIVYLLTTLTSAIVLGPITALLNLLSPFGYSTFLGMFILTLIYSIFFCFISLPMLLIYNFLVIKFRLNTLLQRVVTGALLALVLSSFPTYLKNVNRPNNILPLLSTFILIGGITGYFHHRKIGSVSKGLIKEETINEEANNRVMNLN